MKTNQEILALYRLNGLDAISETLGWDIELFRVYHRSEKPFVELTGSIFCLNLSRDSVGKKYYPSLSYEDVVKLTITFGDELEELVTSEETNKVRRTSGSDPMLYVGKSSFRLKEMHILKSIVQYGVYENPGGPKIMIVESNEGVLVFLAREWVQ